MPAAIRDAAIAAQGVDLDGDGNMDIGTDSLGNPVPGMYLNAAETKLRFLSLEDWQNLVLEDLKILDKPLGGQSDLVLFPMDLIGMHTIHMDSLTECSTAVLTMQLIWHMQYRR